MGRAHKDLACKDLTRHVSDWLGRCDDGGRDADARTYDGEEDVLGADAWQQVGQAGLVRATIEEAALAGDGRIGYHNG